MPSFPRAEPTELLYVALVAPGVVNTMPQATFDAYAELEREGVKAFCDSHVELLSCIDERVRELAAPAASARRLIR